MAYLSLALVLTTFGYGGNSIRCGFHLIAFIGFHVSAYAKSEIYEGKVCMTVEHFHAGPQPTDFFECTPLSDDEVARLYVVRLPLRPSPHPISS